MNKKIVYRHELKYLIDIRDYFILKSKFKAVLKQDKHSLGENGYHLRSLYFDDMKNTDMFGKLSGVSERKKYRIRTYNNSLDLIRFEKKVKDNNVSYKRSSVISVSQAEAAIKGDFSSFEESDDPLLREIFLYDRRNILRANVITDYDREAFIMNEGNVRLTFDKNLKTALNSVDLFNPKLMMFPAVAPGQIILEVKYDAFLPEIISRLLGGTNALYMAISKFALCKKYNAMNNWEIMQ